MKRKYILLVEDDLTLQTLIKEYLETYQYACNAYANPLDALSEFQENSHIYTMAVLDLGLPNMDGFDLFKKLKSIYDIPIIISTARGDIGNKIYGFELGADDYLSKPYEPRELILRISLTLRRASLNSTSNDIQTICNFEINKKTKQVFFEHKDCEFTKIEFEIFVCLLTNANINITRSQIIHTTSLNENTKDRTIDTHIRNIRVKIHDDFKNPKYIKSMWGIGYKFIC